MTTKQFLEIITLNTYTVFSYPYEMNSIIKKEMSILTAQYKNWTFPSLTRWRYSFLALSHWYLILDNHWLVKCNYSCHSTLTFIMLQEPRCILLVHSRHRPSQRCRWAEPVARSYQAGAPSRQGWEHSRWDDFTARSLWVRFIHFFSFINH